MTLQSNAVLFLLNGLLPVSCVFLALFPIYNCAVGAPRTSDYRPALYDTVHPSPPFFLPDLPEA